MQQHTHNLSQSSALFTHSTGMQLRRKRFLWLLYNNKVNNAFPAVALIKLCQTLQAKQLMPAHNVQHLPEQQQQQQ